MPIRIGANPIGWSNDDLLEIGGDTPLETCLAEAREAGFEGMELGNKFPREPAALKAALAPFGMACVGRLVLGRAADTARRSDEFAAARAHIDLLKAMGSKVFIIAETSNAIHGDRSMPLSQRPRLGADDWAELGTAHDRLRRQDPRRGPARGLPPPHGHHRAERGRHRRASWPRPARPSTCCSTPATPPGAGRTRRAWLRRYRDRISHFHAKDVRARHHGQGDCRGLELPGLHPRQGRRTRRLHRAGRRHASTTPPFSRRCRAIPAGSSSRPSRTPRRPTRCAYAKRGVAHLKQALKSAGLA